MKLIGSSFLCDKCGSKFERPRITHTCGKCSANFTYKEADYKQLPSYEVTEKTGNLAPNKMVSDTTSQLEKALIKSGFKVEYNYKQAGKSGVDQSFDIAARRGNKLYLIEISPWGEQNDLISLLGKKMDIKADAVILIDLSGNPKLTSLGKTYGIEVLNNKDPAYLEQLTNLLITPEKESAAHALDVFKRIRKSTQRSKN